MRFRAFALLLAVLPSLALAGWLDPSWQYRAPITVSNNGSALTSYQVLVNTTNLVYNNTGLVGSWHFSESAGVRFADSSGNGNDGTYNGETFNTGTLTNFALNASSGWTAGRYGKALQFDGADDFVSVGASASHNLAGDFAIVFWAKMNDKTRTQRVVGYGTGNNGLGIGQNPGWGSGLRINYYAQGVDWNSAEITGVNNGEWHFYAIVRSGTTVNYYVDNLTFGSSGSTNGFGNAASSLFIGKRNDAGIEYFSGAIDNVGIYGRSLSVAEIGQVYQNNTFFRSGLVSYWRLDEGSGTVAQDTHHLVTPDNQNGTRFGNALSFDGANDYANVPSASLGGFRGTIEAWAYLKSFGTGSCNVHNGVSSCSAITFNHDYGYFFGINSDGALILDMGNGASWQTIHNTQPGLVATNAWYHIAVTTDSGNTVRYYVNGVLVNSSTVGYATMSTGSQSRLGIGGWSLGATPFFLNGTVDEVRIYNRTLSASEIQQRYNASRLRLDYADLRFANSSDSSLPYWQENDNRAWVKVPYVPNGTSTVYAYYGNPNASSASNGTNTLEFFDDFGGTSLDTTNRWTEAIYDGGVPHSFSEDSGYWKLKAWDNGGCTDLYYKDVSKLLLSNNQSVRAYYTLKSVGRDYGIGVSSQMANGTYLGITGYTATPAQRVDFPFTVPSLGTHYFDFYGHGASIDVYHDGSLKHTYDVSGYADTRWSFFLFFEFTKCLSSGTTSEIWWDYASVRKYASPEPAASLQAEEFIYATASLGVSPAGKTASPNSPEQFALWIYNNQAIADNFTLSCSGTCSYSENPVITTAYQNRSVTVTITSAGVSGTTDYLITATSQANASNFAPVYASLTVDVTKWRGKWNDPYNSAFIYRIPIALNNTGSALMDYPVNVTIDTASLINAGKMRSDCGDVRITNGSNEMPYWIESGCNTPSTKIWARVPQVPGGTSTIYAYYGNAGATYNNSIGGNNTFDFFDDFEGYGLGDINGKGGWVSVAYDDGSPNVVSSDGRNMLRIRGTVSNTLGGVARHAVAFNQKQSVIAKVKGVSQSEQITFMMYDGTPVTWPSENHNGYNFLHWPGTYYPGIAKGTGSGVTWLRGVWAVDSAASVQSYYTLESVWSGTSFKALTNGVLKSTGTNGDYASRNYLGITTAHTSEWYVDYVLVRKYASPEPSLSFQQEETGNPALFIGVSPASKTTYPTYSETFSLWAYNNQTFSDTFTLSCAGTCSVSPPSLPLTAYQNGSATVTITSANVSGTTNYVIMATSQSNASNSAAISASLTVDTTKWRDNWTDAYGNGFKYRMPITINNSGSALADYQLNITIDTSTPMGLARMRSDCGDMRFTNGTNEMPYWIESGCNTTTTKIWVKVLNLPAGNSTVYAYYGSPSMAGAGSFSSAFIRPDSVAGLKLWLKADAITGLLNNDPVGTWADSSANGKNAVQGTAGNKPLYKTNVANGMPAVQFDGVDDWLSATAIGAGYAPEVFIVINVITYGAAGIAYSSPQNGYGTGTYAAGSGNFGSAATSGALLVSRPLALGAWGVVRNFFGRDLGAGASQFAVNGGQSAYTTSSGTYSAASLDNIDIGRYPAASHYQNAYIAEVIVYSGPLSDADRKSIERNLAAKYGIVLAGYHLPQPTVSAGAEQSKGYRLLVRRCGLKQANANVTAYQAGNATGACVSDPNGICSLEISAGTYDLQFRFADNSTAWKNATAFS